MSESNLNTQPEVVEENAPVSEIANDEVYALPGDPVKEEHVDVPGHDEYVKEVEGEEKESEFVDISLPIDKKGFKSVAKAILESGVAYSRDKSARVVNANVLRILVKMWNGSTRITGKKDKTIVELYTALVEEFRIGGELTRFEANRLNGSKIIQLIISFKNSPKPVRVMLVQIAK